MSGRTNTGLAKLVPDWVAGVSVMLLIISNSYFVRVEALAHAPAIKLICSNLPLEDHNRIAAELELGDNFKH